MSAAFSVKRTVRSEAMLPLRDPFERCGPALYRIHTGAILRRLRAREHRFDRNAGPVQPAELTDGHPHAALRHRGEFGSAVRLGAPTAHRAGGKPHCTSE